MRAINRGVRDAVGNPEAGHRRSHAPGAYADRSAEMLRLKTTLAIEMAHPEGRRLGIARDRSSTLWAFHRADDGCGEPRRQTLRRRSLHAESFAATGERVTSLAKS